MRCMLRSLINLVTLQSINSNEPQNGLNEWLQQKSSATLSDRRLTKQNNRNHMNLV